MKHTCTRILLILFVGLLVDSCSNKPTATSISSDPASPAKEILISNEGFERPYIALGHVEYTLKSKASIFVTKIRLRNQAIDFLKKEAVGKYGDKVDAIIETKVQERTEIASDDKLNVTYVQGIAISFKPEEKTPESYPIKRKIKPKKHPVRKTKPPKSTFPITEPQEIEITPSEILK